MKKIFILLVIFAFNFQFAQNRRFFNSGKAQLTNNIEKINLNYQNSLPFVNVNIGGTLYKFLLDTGAPTVISPQIFADLGLKALKEGDVKDSQKNSKKQIFTYLPEMKVDNVIFKDVGVVVMDFDASELKCLGFEGILGANQMSKLVWNINYKNNLIQVAEKASAFPISDYPLQFSFDVKPQKSPVVYSEIYSDKIPLTFDTGFSGKVKVISKNDNLTKNMKNGKYITLKGVSSIGAFGNGSDAEKYVFVPNKMSISNNAFPSILIEIGESNLIGNEFLENFDFIIDWNTNTIYLKQISEDNNILENFGYGFQFRENKAIVSYIYEGSELKVGDQILKVNNINLENLSKEEQCIVYLENKKDNSKSEVALKIKRENMILELQIKKKKYFQ